jgi:hypothetical protein
MTRLLASLAIALVFFAIGAARLSATAAGPAVALSASSGKTGTTINVSGLGFPPNEIVAVYIDQPGPYLSFPGPKADGQGAFHMTFVWPPRTFDKSGRVDPTRPGAHAVCGDTGWPGSTQPVAAKACAQFTVEGGPSPSPTEVPANTADLVPVAIAAAVILIVGGAIWVWVRRSA